MTTILAATTAALLIAVVVLARRCRTYAKRIKLDCDVIRIQHRIITEWIAKAAAQAPQARPTVSLGEFEMPLPPCPPAARSYYSRHGRN